PQSQSFYRRFGSNLPTSLICFALLNQRYLTLETCCSYWYGSKNSIDHWFFNGPELLSWTLKCESSFTVYSLLKPTLFREISELKGIDVASRHSSGPPSALCVTTLKSFELRNISLILFRESFELINPLEPTNPKPTTVPSEPLST